MAPNGKIYCAPGQQNIIVVIDPHAIPDPNDLIIPADLSLLPTSKYNMYCNKF